MRTVILKSLRDLRARRWQAIGLSVLVATIVAATGGTERAGRMLTHTREHCYEDLALADLEIHCSPTIPGLLQEDLDLPGVVAAEEVSLFPGVVHRTAAPAVSAVVRVLPADGARINTPSLLEGRLPRPEEAGVLVDRSMHTIFDFEPGDTLDLEMNGERRVLPILGITLSPDHVLFPSHPEYFIPVPGTIASVALSAAAARDYPHADLVTVLRFRLAEGQDPDPVAETLIERLGISPIAVLPREDMPDYRSTSMIVRFFDIYLPAGELILILVALTLLVLTLHRGVRNQTRQIGLLSAAGHRPSHIALGYMVLPLATGFVGAGLGALAHGWYGRFIFESYARGVGFAPLQDPGPGIELLYIAGACITIGSVVGFLLALHAAVKRPLALLRPAPSHAAAFRPLAAFSARVRRALGLPLSVRLGLTYLSRRRWVSVATVICLGGNLALVAAFLYVHVTHVEETERNMRRIGRDATVYFEPPVHDDDLAAIAAKAEGEAEAIIATNLLAAYPGGRKLQRTYCLSPDGWLRNMTLVRGRSLEDTAAAEILIDQWVADEQGVDLGDELTCHPWYSAPEGRRFRIVGVVGGPSHGLILMPLEAGRALLGLPGLTTTVGVSSPLPAAELEARLRSLTGVKDVQSLARARDQVGLTFAGLERVLAAAVVMSVIVAVLFLGMLAALDADDRAPDLAVLRAIGWRERSLFVLCLTEVLARGGLAFLLSIPLAPWLALWLIEQLRIANRYRLDLWAPPWVILLIGGACLVLMPLGVVPAWRAARRIGAGAAVRLLAQE